MTYINLPNRAKLYTTTPELQNYLKIHVHPCKCKVPPLRLHYSNQKYKLSCLRCKRRVGTMEIHGSIIVSAKDIHRFIRVVTERYQSSPEMAKWELNRN